MIPFPRTSPRPFTPGINPSAQHPLAMILAQAPQLFQNQLDRNTQSIGNVYDRARGMTPPPTMPLYPVRPGEAGILALGALLAKLFGVKDQETAGFVQSYLGVKRGAQEQDFRNRQLQYEDQRGDAELELKKLGLEREGIQSRRSEARDDLRYGQSLALKREDMRREDARALGEQQHRKEIAEIGAKAKTEVVDKQSLGKIGEQLLKGIASSDKPRVRKKFGDALRKHRPEIFGDWSDDDIAEFAALSPQEQEDLADAANKDAKTKTEDATRQGKVDKLDAEVGNIKARTALTQKETQWYGKVAASKINQANATVTKYLAEAGKIKASVNAGNLGEKVKNFAEVRKSLDAGLSATNGEIVRLQTTKQERQKALDRAADGDQAKRIKQEIADLDELLTGLRTRKEEYERLSSQLRADMKGVVKGKLYPNQPEGETPTQYLNREYKAAMARATTPEQKKKINRIYQEELRKLQGKK